MNDEKCSYTFFAEVVENQLDLIESHVPDWICKKLVTSGDTIYKWVEEII